MATPAISRIHERGKGKPSSNVGGEGNAWHSKDIQAALSTQIVVQAADATGALHTVGAIQTLTPTETRPLIRISEVGTDGVLEIVPNAAFTIELAVTRLVFDYRRLPASFGKSFRHIHAQRLPFDIVMLDYNPYIEHFDSAGVDNPSTPKIDANHEPRYTVGTPDANYADNGAVVNAAADAMASNATQVIKTRYKNCWLTSYSYTYDQSNYLITENATVWAETVYDEDSPIALNGTNADLIEAFFNQTAESNAMATAFIGGR